MFHEVYTCCGSFLRCTVGRCSARTIEKHTTDTDSTQWHILRHPKDVDVTFTGDV